MVFYNADIYVLDPSAIFLFIILRWWFDALKYLTYAACIYGYDEKGTLYKKGIMIGTVCMENHRLFACTKCHKKDFFIHNQDMIPMTINILPSVGCLSLKSSVPSLYMVVYMVEFIS